MSNSKSSINNAIKSYLAKENRPYSAQDIFNNMNKQFGKTAITKALDELADNNAIKMKINGKQKIYFADQSLFTDASDSKLVEMDAQIAQLNDSYNKLRETVKEKESQLSIFKNSESRDTIQFKINKCRQEIAQYKNKLAQIENKTQDLDASEMEGLKRKRNELAGEWRKRKRLATQILDTILESYPKPRKVLIEEIGWETDTDHNVTVPNLS